MTVKDMACPEMPKKKKRAVPKEHNGYRVQKSSKANRITKRAAKAEDAAAHNKQSPLLRLPGELRNRIYEYAIGGNEVVLVEEDHDAAIVMFLAAPYGRGQKSTSKAWDQLFNLSKTSRQLYHETRLLPFSKNVFSICLEEELEEHLSELEATDSFFSELKKAQKEAITTITIDVPLFLNRRRDTYSPSIPDCLKDFTNLKTIICMATLNSSENRVVEKFAKKRGLEVLFERKDIMSATAVDWDNCFTELIETGMCARRHA